MASDDVPESEQPEIIPKPPSHPITTTLLITTFFGTILCIAFVWAELFGTYLPNDKDVPPDMAEHKFQKVKQKYKEGGAVDHYALDFPDKDPIEYQVKKDLKLLESQQKDN